MNSKFPVSSRENTSSAVDPTGPKMSLPVRIFQSNDRMDARRTHWQETFVVLGT
jgi:hypothetical protein